MVRLRAGYFWIVVSAAIILVLSMPFLPGDFRIYPLMALGILCVLQAWWLRSRFKDSPETKSVSVATANLLKTADSVSRQNHFQVSNENGLMQRAFNHAPVAMVMIDQARLVYDLNKAALELAAFGREQAIGRRPGEVFRCVSVVESGEICGEGPNCAHCPLRNRVNETFETGKTLTGKRAVFRTVGENGEMLVKWLEFSTEKVRLDDTEIVMICFSDTTHHQAVKTQLSAQKQMLEHFHQAHQEIIRADDLPTVFNGAVNHVVLMDPVRYCWVSRYSEVNMLEELWTSGKHEWDSELRLLYGKYDPSSIPCLATSNEAKKLCLFDSRNQSFSQCRIFKLFPGSLLAVCPLALQDNSTGFISFALNADVDEEFKTLLTSLIRDIDLKQKFLRGRSEIEKSLEEAQSANRAKQDFLSVLSHELLTPLNPIQGYSNMLLDSVDDLESRAQLNEIIAGTNRMSKVISQMLEFLHLQNNVTQVFIEERLLLDAIEKSIEPYRSHHESSILFQIKNGQEGLSVIDASEVFNFDERIVQSIISKLLDNAFKFTTEGFVEIAYGFEDETNTLNIFVRDSGIGVPKDQRDSIFREFSGIDTSHSRPSGGSGLGLAICQRYLRLMRGSIDLQSHEGHGSMFHVKIPIERVIVDSQKSIQEEENECQSSLSGFHALLVDDSAMNRKLLHSMLRQYGMHCEEAADGQIALNKCNTIRYDLILTDIHMPFMTGEQLTRMIRMGYGKNANTPIIGVTADSSDELKLRAMHNGFDGWILKPINKRLLEREVQRTLRKNKQEKNTV